MSRLKSLRNNEVMDLRPYLASDLQACLDIYDASAVTLAPTHPRQSFQTFLQNSPLTFFVLEHDANILGCGGYHHVEGSQQAELVWGMIHSKWHRQGLGRFLLMFRLREITKRNKVQLVHLEVPQQLAAFYQRQGFHIAAQKIDGYGSGLDKIELTKKLTVCP